LLALVMGLVTGTALLGVLYLWTGVWPGRFLWAVWLLSGLVALFWIAVALILGLRARHYMAGAIAGVLGGVIVFFIGGGMGPVRYYPEKVLWVAWLFPNTYAVDPLRDLVLFRTLPVDRVPTLLTVAAFAIGACQWGSSSPTVSCDGWAERPQPITRPGKRLVHLGGKQSATAHHAKSRICPCPKPVTFAACLVHPVGFCAIIDVATGRAATTSLTGSRPVTSTDSVQAYCRQFGADFVLCAEIGLSAIGIYDAQPG